MTEINLGLNNSQLYKGCEIKEVGGRDTLITAASEASNIVGRNCGKILEEVEDFSEVILTGPMAVWSYLVVFHQVVHRFSRVVYKDGRGNQMLIAQH